MPADLTATQEAQSEIIPLGTRNGIELAIARRTAKTLGKVISKLNSPDLIDGVQIESLQVYPDDRGFFTELARLGKGLAAKMVPDEQRKIQISLTLTYPGTIKAIHYHSEQTDLWAPVSGMVQVFLYDLRRRSRPWRHQHNFCGSIPALGNPHSSWRRPRLQKRSASAHTAGLLHRSALQPC